MKKIIKRIPLFLLILFLAGLLYYSVSFPEDASTKLLSGNPSLLGRAIGMALGFSSMLILINFTLGFLVASITRSVYWGSVACILLAVTFSYWLRNSEIFQSNNWILQMITLGGGATLLTLQTWGKLKIRFKKTLSPTTQQ